jgi:hypothetical protein
LRDLSIGVLAGGWFTRSARAWDCRAGSAGHKRENR